MNEYLNIRENYPLCNKNAYLDNPSSGLIPTYAVDAMTAYLYDRYKNAMDSEKYFAGWTFLDELRENCAQLLRCTTQEIVFGESSSALLNIFANGIELQPGDNIVSCSTAWPAVSYVWLNKENQGIELRLVEGEKGKITAQQLFEQVDERTKAICICHVDHHTGYKHNLKQIGAYCREHNIFFAVDATQSCGVLNIDVKDMQVDFLCTSSYKWLQGALGLGFAYIDESLLPKLKQTDVGWVGTIDRQKNTVKEFLLTPDASRYEYGGHSIIAAKGLNQTVKAYLGHGAENIEHYVMQLVEQTYQLIQKSPNIDVFGEYSLNNRSSIICISFPKEWTHITTKYLKAHGVYAAIIKPGVIRIGIHYFNILSDVERLITLLCKNILIEEDIE